MTNNGERNGAPFVVFQWNNPNTCRLVDRACWRPYKRDDIPHYIKAIVFHYRRDRTEIKVDRLIALITMQLNPSNPIDANMIGLLPLFATRVEREDQNYRELERAFVRHAQFLLKEEWEKVKYEAMGYPSKLLSYKASTQRRSAYIHFCSWTESLVDRIPDT